MYKYLVLFAFCVGILLPAISVAETAGPLSVRIAHLQIKADQLAAFTTAVKEEMEAALRLEAGVVAIYAVADKNNPNNMTFFEIYINEDAYNIHRQTAHFQKYFHTTKDMIASRVLLECSPVEMRDKYNTPPAQ